MKTPGLCVVLSAPSGGGKTTIIRELVTRNKKFKHSISYTTRSPRNVSGDAGDYHFVTETEFKRMVDAGEMLEWAQVHGNCYGTSGKDLNHLLDQGFNVVMDIDVQGAIQLRDKLPDAVFVFIIPPSMEELRNRLTNRRSETPEALQRRLDNARREIESYTHYDYIIVNDKLELAIDQLQSILIAEHLRMNRKNTRNNVSKCLKGIK